MDAELTLEKREPHLPGQREQPPLPGRAFPAGEMLDITRRMNAEKQTPS
jgi:hypothetical protein